MDLSKFKLHFIDIVEALCKRPRMYTLNGTFGEIIAHLEGYANGKALGPKGRSGSYFNRFYSWLDTTHPDDSQRLKELITLQSHQEALSEFARLYRLYEDANGSPNLKS
jgi:hypothetical protein